jgi:hypothetical protein
MEFFSSAISTLKVLVIALGAGLAAWGAINLMEGYGNDNPGAKSQGIKQLMAGGVVLAAEDEKLKNFFKMMTFEMKKRKETFAKLGITSFSSYREAGYTDIPQIVVLIDNFLGLRELYPQYEDNLTSIIREGVSVGICIVMTSLQTSGIGYKFMSNFPNRICLFCNQSDEYGTLFDRCHLQPKNVPGRGLVLIDKVVYEYQTYLAFEGEKEIDRVRAFRALSRRKIKPMQEYLRERFRKSQHGSTKNTSKRISTTVYFCHTAYRWGLITTVWSSSSAI